MCLGTFLSAILLRGASMPSLATLLGLRKYRCVSAGPVGMHPFTVAAVLARVPAA